MTLRDDRLGIYLLDVGQGDATIVLPPAGEGDAVVFDCRDSSVVIKLLDHWGVPRIEALIASHLDADHVSGMADVLARFRQRIKTVYLSCDRDLAAEGAVWAKRLAGAAVEGRDAGDWELVPSSRDPRPVAQGGNWSIELLAPEHAAVVQRDLGADWEEPNASSAVLRVRRGATSVLIGGDAPLSTLAALGSDELRAAVFRVPHHGGSLGDGAPAGWDVERLYREVGAACSVVSVGTSNAHGHPEPAWVAPACRGGGRLLCTQVTSRCQDGLDQDDCRLVADLRKTAVRSEHLVEPAWRHLTDKNRQIRRGLREVPCAGTVVVSLAADGAVTVSPPASGAHDRVVDEWSHPLCRASQRVASDGV